MPTSPKRESGVHSISTRVSCSDKLSDKLYDRPFREQHGTAADNASAFISSAINEK